jgi:hypothetical protein
VVMAITTSFPVIPFFGESVRFIQVRAS